MLDGLFGNMYWGFKGFVSLLVISVWFGFSILLLGLSNYMLGKGLFKYCFICINGIKILLL